MPPALTPGDRARRAFAAPEAEARARLPSIARGTIPYAGDPRVVPFGGGRPDQMDTWLVLYAAAVMRRRGLLPHEAGRVDGIIVADRTVVFVTADARQRELCRMTVPNETRTPDLDCTPPRRPA